MKSKPGIGDVDLHTYIKGVCPGYVLLPKSLLWLVGPSLFVLGFCLGSMLTEAFL